MQQISESFDLAQIERIRDAYWGSTMAAGYGNIAYYWKVTERDASNRVTEYLSGNGLVNRMIYDQGSGNLKTIRTGLLTDTLRELDYTYDTNNNVTNRVDSVNDIHESYSYDVMDRLTYSRVNSQTHAGSDYNKTTYWNYNAIGNITYQSGVGSYRYSNTVRPHAVAQAGSLHYSYDGNGNMLSGDGKSYSWTSFNKPYRISKASVKSEFNYAPNRARYHHASTDTRNNTTHRYYVGRHFEKLVKPNGKVETKNYIFAGGKMVAEVSDAEYQYMYYSGNSLDVKYMHHDALGSVDLITNYMGQPLNYNSFSAFGSKRTNINRSLMPSGTSLHTNLFAQQYNRGYTGHEQLDDLGLIHMNGRVYDPTLARFVSADPHIQAPYNSQSLNRYSYALNNPMKYVDPSGFFFKKLFKKLKNAIKSLIKTIVAAVILVVAAYIYLQTGLIPPEVFGLIVTGAIGAVAGHTAAIGADSTRRSIGSRIRATIGNSIRNKLFRRGGDTGGFNGTLQGFTPAGFTQPALSFAPRTNSQTAATFDHYNVFTSTADSMGAGIAGKFANGASSYSFAYMYDEAENKAEDERAREQLSDIEPRPNSPLYYGNYYGAGHLGDELYPNPEESPFPPIDVIDTIAKHHDIAYHKAGIEFSVFSSSKQLPIDREFIEELRSINEASLTADQQRYRNRAIILFEQISDRYEGRLRTINSDPYGRIIE